MENSGDDCLANAVEVLNSNQIVLTHRAEVQKAIKSRTELLFSRFDFDLEALRNMPSGDDDWCVVILGIPIGVLYRNRKNLRSLLEYMLFVGSLM